MASTRSAEQTPDYRLNPFSRRLVDMKTRPHPRPGWPISYGSIPIERSNLIDKITPVRLRNQLAKPLHPDYRAVEPLKEPILPVEFEKGGPYFDGSYGARVNVGNDTYRVGDVPPILMLHHIAVATAIYQHEGPPTLARHTTQNAEGVIRVAREPNRGGNFRNVLDAGLRYDGRPKSEDELAADLAPYMPVIMTYMNVLTGLLKHDWRGEDFTTIAGVDDSFRTALNLLAHTQGSDTIFGAVETAVKIGDIGYMNSSNQGHGTIYSLSERY